jgi:hypothetical protein
MWALDDGKRHPELIKSQALKLISNSAWVWGYAAIARRSPELAEATVNWLKEIHESTNAPWADFTPDQRTWWQFHVPPPPWLQVDERSDSTRLSALYEALNIDLRPGVTSNDDDLADLRAEAVLHVEEKFHEQMERVAALLPGKLRLISELRGERWKLWKTNRIQAATRFIVQLAPLVSGFAPAREADKGYRNTRDLREAKKRGGTGGRHAQATGTKTPWAVKVDSDDTLLAPLTAPGPTAEEKADATQLLCEARERWGASGEKLLQAILQNATMEEAAAEAGISESSAYRRLATLRRGGPK